MMNLDNPIIADSPKKQLDEIASFQTQIEYKQFIDTVYHYITTHSIKDSICIGLEGSWGSGKSSIINFLQEKLNDTKEYQYVIFNPWYVTDTTNIISQFFIYCRKIIKNTSLQRYQQALSNAR